MPIEESKVFISYSRQDADFALKLGKDLKAKGINIWVDKLDIKPGEIWDNAVEKAMKTSGKVLIVLSPTSVSSLNVMDELSYAFDEGKTIIPVLHIECDRPFRLRRRQFCDFTKNYDVGLNDLLRAFDITSKSAKEEISQLPKVDSSGPSKEDLKQKKEEEAEQRLKQEAEVKKKAEEEKKQKKRKSKKKRLRKNVKRKNSKDCTKRKKLSVGPKKKNASKKRP